MAFPERNYNADIEPDIRPDFGGDHASEPESDDSRKTSSDLRDLERGTPNTYNREAMENGDTNSVREQEENPLTAITHTNKSTPKIPTSKQELAKVLIKRGGPVGAILGVLLLLGAGVGMFVPGSVFLNLKENLSLHWDQQNFTAEIRSRSILTKRLGSQTTNSLCSTIKLACRYDKPSNKMLNDLDKAGIKALKADGTVIERQRFLAGDRPAFYAYDQGLDADSLKKAVQSGDLAKNKLIKAADFGKELSNNVEFRNAFRRAYNPRWVNWFDDSALKFLQKLGLSKALNKTITEAADPEALDKAMADVVEGRSNTLGATDDAARIALEDSVEKEGKTLAKTASHEISGKSDAALMTAAATCVGMQVPGVYTTVMRNFRMMQMAAVVFQTVFVAADAVKSGNGTPKMAENMGNLLTERPTVTDANGKTSLGKSAMDSGAILYGILGDRGSALQSKTVKKYIPGNIGMSPKLASLVSIGQTKTVKDVCRAATGPEAQVAVDALKVAKLSNPIGWAMLGVDFAVLVADKTGLLEKILTPIIENIVQTVSGMVDWTAVMKKISGPIMEDAKYEEYGDMVGVLSSVLATKSNSVGNLPLTPEAKVAFDQQVTSPVRLAWAQEDRLTHSPFDASNPNTLLGSMVTQLLPYYHSNASVFDNITTTLSYIAKSPGKLLSAPAFADDSVNDWVNQCPAEGDYAIAVSGVAAGPLCDVQYGVPANYVGTDPEEVLRFLHEKNQIDDNGEIIAGSDMENWITLCNSGNTYSLTECKVDTSNRDDVKLHSYMALYQIDKQLLDGMDNEIKDEVSTASGTSTSPTTTTTGSQIDGDDYKVNSITYAYGTNQCVDFVLYRLVKHGVLSGPMALGNGKDVVGTLGGLGFTVDKTPALHAVMSTPDTSQPQYGHTAMVSGVNADGSFVVEEYNYSNPLHYDTRVIPASDIAAKHMTFAHTETKYQ